MAYQVEFLVAKREKASFTVPDWRGYIVAFERKKGEYVVVGISEVFPSKIHDDVTHQNHAQQQQRHDSPARPNATPCLFEIGRNSFCLLAGLGRFSPDHPSNDDGGRNGYGGPNRPKVQPGPPDCLNNPPKKGHGNRQRTISKEPACNFHLSGYLPEGSWRASTATR